MKYLPNINPLDYKFMAAEADPNFDPEHNRRVIANSIKKYETNRRKKIREYQDQLHERSAAIASYLKATERGGVNSDIRKFFNQQQLAHLRGQQILDKLRQAENHGKADPVKV